MTYEQACLAAQERANRMQEACGINYSAFHPGTFYLSSPWRGEFILRPDVIVWPNNAVLTKSRFSGSQFYA